MKFLLSKEEARRFERDDGLITTRKWTLALGDRLIRSKWSIDNPVPCTLYCYALHTKYDAMLIRAVLCNADGSKKIHYREMKLLLKKKKSTDELVKELMEDD